MLNMHRFFPLGGALVVGALFEVVYARPKAILPVALAALLLTAGLARMMRPPAAGPNPGQADKLVARLATLSTPVFLIWSGLAFSLLVERSLVRHGLAILMVFLAALFWESMTMAGQNPSAFKDYALENLGSYLATLTVFFGVSALLGMRLLLSLNLGLAAAILMVLIFILTHAVFWFSGWRAPGARLLAGLITLLALEVFLALSALPLDFMVGGAVLMVLWYIATMLSRTSQLGLLNKKILYRHLGFGGALLLLLFLTTEWI